MTYGRLFLALVACVFTMGVSPAQDLDARIAARLENRVTKLEKELAELRAEFQATKPKEVAPPPKVVSQDTPKLRILTTVDGRKIQQQEDGTYRFVGGPVFVPQSYTPVYQFGSPCANGRCPR